MPKYIFVTGGVVSGIGKGITAASLASLLKSSGLKIFMQKLDPYLNVDPGTMNPYQHGEVFVTKDGAETDLDLGHYERFIDEDLNETSSITSGKIYQSIISKERKGLYHGSTVQVVPHVTNEIKERIYGAAKKSEADVIFIEVGGTIGDIESLPFIESIRQIKNEVGSKNILFIHVALIPYLKASKEFKTKPIQHSVKELLSYGVQPDIIVARSEELLSEKTINKISLFCNLPSTNILNAVNVQSIYEIPVEMYKQKAHELVMDLLELKPKTQVSIDGWKKFNSKIQKSNELVEVDIVGKYTELPDAYLSVIESLNIAGFENKTKVKINWLNSEIINLENYKSIFKNSKGILIPGGFGSRGVTGKMLAAKFARENKIPFLGICLGMQVAVIEFARNVLNLKDANTTEFNKKTNDPVFDIIVKNNEKLGGTLHLGAYEIELLPNTLAYKLFGKITSERHRHRFEFNNAYKEKLEDKGMKFSGIYKSRNMLEVVEIPDHPFFIGTQFHPEFTSRPNKPNKIFEAFVKTIKK
ncbi:CTP synthase [Spiroplasma endosymbiont of Amphibalanus improvisus]|uniref:CTP synthase n=1 Tax=Spiroplasma endosymbiont of Amphibalanus improvisus TaxID=3066327 RepID=UPI00313B9BD6